MNTSKYVAAAYGGIALMSVLRPALVPNLFGGAAPTADSRTEIRAVYGGIPAAFALALLQAGKGGPNAAGLTAAVRYASYGMGLTRLLSSGYERRFSAWPTGAFAAFELAAGAALNPNLGPPGNP